MTTSASGSRLRQIGPDREIETEPTPAADRGNEAALSMLLLALKTIGQRFVVALGQLTTALGVGSVWWLFYDALPTDPSVHQLIGLGLYGALVLAVVWMRR